MSASEQTAVLQEVLDQAHLYRQQAAFKNGLPGVPPRNVIDGEDAGEAPVAPAIPAAVAAALPTAIAQPVRSAAFPLLIRLLIGAGLLSSGGSLGILLAGLFARSATPSVPPTATPPTATMPAAGDLLKELRRHGYHLPPTEAKGVAP